MVLAKFSKEKIVYVDETGFNQYLHREYGRAKKGTVITGLISGKRFRRTSLVAGLVNRNQLIVALHYEGTIEKYWANLKKKMKKYYVILKVLMRHL